MLRHLEPPRLFGGCRDTNVLQILAERGSWWRGCDIWRTYVLQEVICFEMCPPNSGPSPLSNFNVKILTVGA